MKRGVLPFLLLLTSALLYAQAVQVTLEPVTIAPGGSGVVRAEYTIPEGMYMALQEQFFFVRIDQTKPSGTGASDLTGLIQAPLSYPPGVEKNGLITYKKHVTLTRTFTVPADTPPGNYTITTTAGYQYCNEKGTCYVPKKITFELSLTVPGNGQALGRGPARDEESTGEAVLAPVGDTADTDKGGRIRESSVLKFLLLALLGGLLLNVMPCVLPLLSVKALNLVQVSGQDRRRIFIGSLFYGLGILASLVILASMVTIIKASGELAGWGFQFQNPVFVLVLVSVIFVFGLSMFDVFTLNAPGGTLAAKAGNRGGYLGSFLTGIFAVLVATPCTAPFLGTALGFAFSQPPIIIYAIFLLVGIGFALPFVVLGAWPALIQKLPKPGEWMNIFKEAMGFLLMGTVLYLLLTLYHQIGGDGLLRALAFMGILAVGAWAYGRFAAPGSPTLRKWITIALVAGIIATGAVTVIKFDGRAGAGTVAQAEYSREDGWEPFSPEAVEAGIASGRPVFINFWATWCTSCKVNKPALYAKEVREAFEAENVLLLQGDFTENDPIIAKWIRDLGRGGVPVYVLYKPGESEPRILPELLSRKGILEALR